MRLGLLSDSHNNWNALKAAVATASRKDCKALFFAGDLTQAAGIEILADFSGPVHLIVGNMDHDIDGIWAEADKTENVIYHGEICDIERDGVRIFTHHYPGPAETKAGDEVYDLCIHGHLHEFRDEQFKNTRLINPGALTRRQKQPEWAIFDTELEKLKRIAV